jgi:hypothetical protein
MPDRRTFATGILPSALSELTALRHPLPSLVSYAGSRGTGDPSPAVWRRRASVAAVSDRRIERRHDGRTPPLQEGTTVGDRRYRPGAIDSRAAWATASAVIPKCL